VSDDAIPTGGVFLLHPWWLLLALVPAAALLLARRRRPPALRFAPHAFLGGEGAPRPPLRARLHRLPAWLEVAGLLLAVVALARPVQRTVRTVPEEGIDILLVLDTSSSMRAADLAAGRSRLAVARDTAAAFVRGRPGDRIGLVTFARYPDLACPPTPDHAALLRVLAAVAPVAAEGPEDATGIGAAVGRAASILADGGTASRVVVLLTDGEENVALPGTPGGVTPAHAARLCEEIGVRVHGIVAGGGAPAGPGRAAADTGPVRRLAERTGGRFFEARDAGALAAVYADIAALERTGFERERQGLAERFPPFLAAAVALLLAGRGLRASVLRVLP
jgi:Ca-activated chloride channel family protein